MIVIEGPEPGHFTDVMFWRDCHIKLQLEVIMQQRVVAEKVRLKLYADKIYNNGPLITAAFSRRHGVVQPWQTSQNSIMSRIRIAVEWSFGKIITQNAFLDFWKNQKIQMSPLAKYYHVATLLTNMHTCLYGAEHCNYFEILPPTLDEYMDQ